MMILSSWNIINSDRFFSIFLFLIVIFLPFKLQAVLWDQVIASFNQNVITLWEIQREMQVERIKRGMTPLKEFGKEEMKAFAKKTIVELLILDEAESFQIAGIEDKVVQSEYLKFKEKFHGEAAFQNFLKQYQWSEKELKKSLVRSLRVELFIKEKILSAYIYFPKEEIKQYQAEHPQVTLVEAQERLKKKRIQENLKDWVQGLKIRSRIRTVWE